MQLTRIAIYCRVSTKDKGQDTENQLRQLREFCLTQGWTIVREYVDRVSGKTGDREQFQEMFAAASRREFDVVLFWALDRFSRDLSDHEIVKAMSTPVAHYVCVDVFSKALKKLTIAEQEPTLLEPERTLSTCQPFPWSRQVWEGVKTVFNLVPCDNGFERDFAKFLDNAQDVEAYAKLPQPFGFSIEYTDGAMNLRSYYPDFVAADDHGVRWLLETKGAETEDVSHKDAAATQWCENATQLTKVQWQYLKIPQKAFEVLQPSRLSDLKALSPVKLF